MRKLIPIISLLQIIIALFLCVPSNGQTREAIFKQETPLTWMGVDFSEARYYGDTATVSASEMKYLFSKINYLIEAEPEKYNLRKFFKKSLVNLNLKIVRQRNDSIDESQIISKDASNLNILDSAKVIKMINGYETGNTKGLVVVFIMETMNKTKEEATMWVTFFDAAEKQVLLTTRLTGAASGIGFRNHWASSVFEVMKIIYSREYKKWQQGPVTEK